MKPTIALLVLALPLASLGSAPAYAAKQSVTQRRQALKTENRRLRGANVALKTELRSLKGKELERQIDETDTEVRERTGRGWAAVIGGVALIGTTAVLSHFGAQDSGAKLIEMTMAGGGAVNVLVGAKVLRGRAKLYDKLMSLSDKLWLNNKGK